MKRALHAAIDQAMAALQGPQPISTQSVRDARKALKRARAALRLARDAMGKAAYRRENRALRDAGRCLAPLREAAALAAALEGLQQAHPVRFGRDALKPAKSALRGRRNEALKELPRRQQECVALLRQARARMDPLLPPTVGAASLGAGVKRIYRKGRKALAQVTSTPSTEALHEWRKQVKYLADALEVLGGPKNRSARKMVKRAAKLSDGLGEEHDLSALEGARPIFLGIDPKVRKKLIATIEQKRAKLRKHALAIGQELYAKKKPAAATRLRASA